MSDHLDCRQSALYGSQWVARAVVVLDIGGRTAIIELVPLDDAFRDLAVRRTSLSDAKAHLATRGIQTLAQSGLKLVESGTTSFSEFWSAVATG